MNYNILIYRDKTILILVRLSAVETFFLYNSNDKNNLDCARSDIKNHTIFKDKMMSLFLY